MIAALWLRLIMWIASRGRMIDLQRPNTPRYLTRYLLWGRLAGDARRETRGNGYLHEIHRPDDDPAPHNHSWKWAFSIVLHGGYVEIMGRTGSWTRVRGPGSCGLLTQDTFHRIISVKPHTWTLFITGPKLSSWGFWVNGRVVPWRERLQQLGLHPDH